jgi:nicotinate-nucleotide pyrophosphorylase (carboxylating)
MLIDVLDEPLRQSAVLCGMAWFNAVFAELDTNIHVDWNLRDGERITADQVLCSVRGPARPILSGERTALNFLQTLSGTATLARRYADCVAGLPVRILDTRKTIPGLRQAQKYAVRTGGCHSCSAQRLDDRSGSRAQRTDSGGAGGRCHTTVAG